MSFLGKYSFFLKNNVFSSPPNKISPYEVIVVRVDDEPFNKNLELMMKNLKK